MHTGGEKQKTFYLYSSLKHIKLHRKIKNLVATGIGSAWQQIVSIREAVPAVSLLLQSLEHYESFLEHLLAMNSPL